MFIDFAALKQRVPIEQAAELLGLETKQEGQALRAPCPACNKGGDRAIVITPSKGAWYCHALQKGGDVLALVAHIREESVKDAAAWLDGKVPNTVPSTVQVSKSHATVPESGRSEDVGDRTPQLQLAKVAARLLHEHPDVQALGLTPDAAEELGIGYDPKGMMKGRVLFPLYKSGELVGFMGYGGTPAVKLPANLLPATNVVKFPKAG